MSFAPVLPSDGYSGWLLLKKTMPTQQKAYQSSPMSQREVEYFRKNIGRVVSAEDLVADRSLLKVALTAFGLEADINARAFIKKILSDGTGASGALANRLADKSYLAFSRSFGLDGTQVPATLNEGFADAVISQFHARRFEAAVGEKNASYRLALNAEREIATLAAARSGEDTKWFSVMGSKPLRQVFETAFGLPSSFRNLDIDQQLKVFKARAHSQFGDTSFSQFSDPERMEKLVRSYLIRDSLSSTAPSPAQAALQLLSTSRR